MRVLATIAMGIAGMFTLTALAQEIAKRPEVPIMIEASSDLDACNATGIATGLDPHGDGFLAVKSAPALQSLRIDKLYNGEQVYICNERDDWYGVVYSKDRRDCNVSTPWPQNLAYTGPCRSGWVYRRWIEVTGG